MNNKILVIAQKDISEVFRAKSTYIVIIIMVVLTISYIVAYETAVKTLSTQQSIIDYSRSFLNNLSYVLPMMFSIFVCSVFANYAVIVDKAKRNIESLMATPVSINQIWLGKTLAVSLPSLVVGIIIAIISLLVMDIFFIMPKTNSFIFPDLIAGISTIILVPALVFVIVSIVTYIQLVITNPRIGNFVFSGFFFLLLIGSNIPAMLGLPVSYFALVYLGFIVICGAVAYFLSKTLTKERVLLSSKI